MKAELIAVNKSLRSLPRWFKALIVFLCAIPSVMLWILLRVAAQQSIALGAKADLWSEISRVVPSPQAPLVDAMVKVYETGLATPDMQALLVMVATLGLVVPLILWLMLADLERQADKQDMRAEATT